VRAFGCKDEEENNVRNGHGWRCEFDNGSFGILCHPKPVRDLDNCAELCYNMRFVQRNGRSIGDPWSVRQIGVYHKYDGTMQRSVWILIGASKRPQSIVEDSRRGGLLESEYSLSAALFLHAILLATTEDDWRTYLEDLGAELNLLVSIMYRSFLLLLTNDRTKRHAFHELDKYTIAITLSLSLIFKKFKGSEKS
jgi:hypothetical protein